MGAADFSDPPWIVGSARVLFQWHGGELWRWLGFRASTSKISAEEDSFYRGFLDWIVGSTNTNNFLVHNQLNQTKIRERIKRG
jgi:hypothetical protein